MINSDKLPPILCCLVALLAAVTHGNAAKANAMTGACSTARCPAVYICPAGQSILCLLERCTLAGVLDIKMIVRNQAFAFEFSNIAASLDSFESGLSSGRITDFSSIGSNWGAVVSNFIKIVREQCLIPVSPQLESLAAREQALQLDQYYRDYLKRNRPLSTCPNRYAVQRELQSALVEGSGFDAVRMIMTPWFEDAMGEIPGYFRELNDMIENRDITSIGELASEINEYFSLFLDTLQGRCAITISYEIVDVIKMSFEKRKEVLYVRMRQNGAVNPEFCPHREAILNFVQSANGSVDVISIISETALGIEFGHLWLSITSLQQRIAARSVQGVPDIVDTIQNAAAGFIALLSGDPGCHIGVSDDFKGWVRDAMVEFEQDMIFRYWRTSRFTGTNSCPKRQALFKILNRASQAGVLNATFLIYNPQLIAEFSQLKEKMDQLENHIRIGLIYDRKMLNSEVSSLVTIFRNVLSEFCKLDYSKVDRLIDEHFANKMEGYCDLFPRRRPFKKVVRKSG